MIGLGVVWLEKVVGCQLWPRAGETEDKGTAFVGLW